jgi:hypothetical protein
VWTSPRCNSITTVPVVVEEEEVDEAAHAAVTRRKLRDKNCE